jgi:hypothetical protein
MCEDLLLFFGKKCKVAEGKSVRLCRISSTLLTGALIRDSKVSFCPDAKLTKLIEVAN